MAGRKRWRNQNAYDVMIARSAAEFGVPPELIKGVIAQESAFRPDAIREEPQINDRSRGLMQILEKTARSLGYAGAFDGLYDPATNIHFGTKLLARNYRTARGNWDVALSAYNAGFSKIRPWDGKRTRAGDLVNQDYVARVQGKRTYFTYKWMVPGAVAGVLLYALFSTTAALAVTT